LAGPAFLVVLILAPDSPLATWGLVFGAIVIA
jgi:hypothetical protein